MVQRSNSPQLPTLRPIGLYDSHHLLDIDLKCFDDPWPPEHWRHMAQGCTGAVAIYNSTPIGFCISCRNEDGDIEISKVGVKQSFRRAGIGTMLVANAFQYAKETAAGQVVITIPETSVCPGEPEDLSLWLQRCDFKARRYLKTHFTIYGESVDGIVFALPVPF